MCDLYIGTRSLQDPQWQLMHTQAIFQHLATALTPLLVHIALETVNTVLQHATALDHNSSVRSQVRTSVQA